MKYLFYILGLIVALLLYLRTGKYERSSELPVFLKPDPIAAAHQTDITVKVHSHFKPDSVNLEDLKEDYSAIWAHLNHLYETNDVNAGKEYYTEDWFKQICKGNNEPFDPSLYREDLNHNLHIINWSSDNLVCTAIDSNAVFSYDINSSKNFERTFHMAFVLLYQGDHWRVDAMKYLNN
ncbi:hypothetical protein [Jiulongibacter sediminis]|mgnify:CR=1 FL=1|jgi:hypothetical protein|uniref:hypothetical protein n=1 Tax=Jiulongibacter sediminis TaxID=1605367 RepID=UPI0026ED5F7B|nr:hypothetical protein [Jiulongibacter sediminis]